MTSSVVILLKLDDTLRWSLCEPYNVNKAEKRFPAAAASVEGTPDITVAKTSIKAPWEMLLI